MIKSAKKSTFSSPFSAKGTMDSIILDPLISSGIPTAATSLTFPLLTTTLSNSEGPILFPETFIVSSDRP